MQVNPHIVPLQVAVAFAGGLHGVHDDVPHELTLVLSAHELPPHSWNPFTHEKPQPPSPPHVGIPSAGAEGHAVHEVPQLCVDELEEQTAPHAWYPLLHPPSLPASVVAGASVPTASDVAESPLPESDIAASVFAPSPT